MVTQLDLNFPRGAAQQWATLSCLLAGLLLTVALYMEHVMGLAPCPLCMMQRLWVVVVGLISFASLAHNPRWGIYPVLNILACLIGGGFSIRQLWLQSLPEDKVPACGPNFDYIIQTFPLSEAVAIMFKGNGNCAEVVWTFLGLSIAGWAFIAFSALLLLTIVQIFRKPA